MSSDELANAATMPGSGDPPASSSRLAAGTVLLDRYRIVRWLGAGGMGAVYAAHDQRLDQPVALKFVAGARSEVERERLRAEVRTLQGLTHRGIARTFTFDEADGEPFIVMELLDGETLSARIARGRLEEPEARSVIGALATALDEAHRAGVVHRDVKPANVMLCPGGRVVLMDFGLARADDAPAPAGEASSMLMTTSLKGTPAYLAPEMALGRRVDARADLYSLGVLAYEALTGALPFQADSAKGMIDQHVERVPDDIRAKRAELSAPLSALITRLLAKEPADRPASASEVVAALAPRRSRWPLIVALAALAIVGVAIVVLLTRPTAARHTPVAPMDPQTLEASRVAFDRAQAAYRSGRYEEALAGWQEAYALYPSPDFLFNLAAVAHFLGDPASEAMYYRRYLATKEVIEPTERARIEHEIADLDRMVKTRDQLRDGGDSPAVRDAGSSERAAYARAEEAYDNRDFVRAYELFRAAYDTHPDPAYLFDIAIAARDARRWADAALFYRRFLQLHPDTPQRAEIEKTIADIDRSLDAGP